MNKNKSPEEHRYTSTGIKFWGHQEQMESYREGTGHTVISTHISPTSRCNLNCSYCSVKKRERVHEIELDTIKDYVGKLKTRGLKAVILTGGGEPTSYPQFNELVKYLHEEKLDLALITNGTLSNKVDSESWKYFSWVRASINQFAGWEEKIYVPKKLMNSEAVLGTSFIWTGQIIDDFKKVGEVARRMEAEYIRVLPNCQLEKKELLNAHERLQEILEELSDPLFFHQFKIHGSPEHDFCHQSVFRPYLSEVDGGTVYPCDSLVLNESADESFNRKFRICQAKDVLEFLDGNIKPNFNPKEDCDGCVFTDNINMIGNWKYLEEKPKGIRIDEQIKKHLNFP